jgi:hypothetical protein
MDINHNTRNLTVMHYPGGAGGKFVTLALGLHPQVLPQDRLLAEAKMRLGDRCLGRDVALHGFHRKRQSGSHWELGCKELAGFNGASLRQDPRADDRAANPLWRRLTHQSQYHFFLIDNTPGDEFARYPLKRNVVLTNYAWIMENRGLRAPEGFTGTKPMRDQHPFDMARVKDPVGFRDEVRGCLGYMALSGDLDWADLERVRQGFMDTHRIGFQ